MYLLYLDESGTQSNARHFVLAGVSVYETNIYWAADQLDRIQIDYFPDIQESLLFHATSLRGRRDDTVPPPFNQLDRKARLEILDKLYDVSLNIRGTFFAVVVEKEYLNEGEDTYERALEDMLSRFDQFLNRRYRERGDRVKGLIVIADSSYRDRLEVVARQLALEGTRWHELRDIVDIPFFTLSKNSRMLQIADLIANTVYGRYESGHASQFDRMIPKFDQDDNNRMHGLVHLCSSRNQCYLPCCLTRRSNTVG